MRGLEAHGESPKSGALPMSSAPICRLSRVGADPPPMVPQLASAAVVRGEQATSQPARSHPTPLTVWFVGPPGAPPASRLAKLGALYYSTIIQESQLA